MVNLRRRMSILLRLRWYIAVHLLDAVYPEVDCIRVNKQRKPRSVKV